MQHILSKDTNLFSSTKIFNSFLFVLKRLFIFAHSLNLLGKIKLKIFIWIFLSFVVTLDKLSALGKIKLKIFIWIFLSFVVTLDKFSALGNTKLNNVYLDISLVCCNFAVAL